MIIKLLCGVHFSSLNIDFFSLFPPWSYPFIKLCSLVWSRTLSILCWYFLQNSSCSIENTSQKFHILFFRNQSKNEKNRTVFWTRPTSTEIHGRNSRTIGSFGAKKMRIEWVFLGKYIRTPMVKCISIRAKAKSCDVVSLGLRFSRESVFLFERRWLEFSIKTIERIKQHWHQQ